MQPVIQLPVVVVVTGGLKVVWGCREGGCKGQGAFQLLGKQLPCQMVHAKLHPGVSLSDQISGLSQASGGCCRPVGFRSLSPGRNEQLLSVNQSFANMIPGAATSASQGTYKKCKFSGPNPDLLYQKFGGRGGGVEIYVLTGPLAVLVHIPLSKKRTPGFSGLLLT